MHKLLAAVALCAAWMSGHVSGATYAWVGHSGGIAVIDVDRGVVVTHVNTAFAINDVAALPGVRRAYAAYDRGIVAIDTDALALVAASPATGPHLALELKPGGEALYATFETDFLSIRATRVLRADTFTVTREIAGGPGHAGEAPPVFDTIRGKAYVPPDDERDLASDQLVRDLPVSGIFEMHPALPRLFVVDGATVRILDLATNAVIATNTVGGAGTFMGARVNNAGTRLFVTDQPGNAVYVLDAATLQVLARLDVGVGPRGIDITPTGDRLFVVNEGGADVSVIDANALAVVGSIHVGVNPRANGRFIGGSSVASSTMPGPGTGLFWNAAEPGWGLHVTQRGSVFFAVLFHYDVTGAARWWVAPSCVTNVSCPNCINNVTCQGPVYSAVGPAFFHAPFSAGAVGLSERGIMELQFTDRDRAHLTYVIDGLHRSLPVARQDFAPAPTLATDYTDLWWNPFESGWGLGITQRGNVMFLTWFVYDVLGHSQWLVASNCAVKPSGHGCTGKLYRTSGPAGPSPASFDAAALAVTEVGEIDVTFETPNSGLITWTVDGLGGARAISRQLF